MSVIEERIHSLGIILPDTSFPPNEHANALYQAHVQPYYRVGDILFLAGQVPMRGKEELYKGRYGLNLTADDGYKAARQCAINALADMKYALGDLDRVEHIIRLECFINATPEFTEHPKVGNGASDLLIEVFGERGRHTRASVGVTGMASGHSIETLLTVHVR
ncbi:MAG: RidA family protein [Alphaproteobacteria bacterium]